MDYRTHLITCCEAYAKATGLSPARIGTLAQNQGAFFKRLHLGAGCTMDTYAKVLGWFSKNWPEGTSWPAGVTRPSPSPEQPIDTEAAEHGPQGETEPGAERVDAGEEPGKERPKAA